MRALLPLALLLGCPPAPVDEPTSGELSVLTYNVHGLPSGITGDDTAARMEQIAPRLADYDLIGIQEDWMPDHHPTLVADAPHPTRIWFDEPVDEDRVYGSGLTVLADLPEVERRLVHYDACHGTLDGASDCLASKGFVAVRLRLGGAELDFYDTHLEAGGGDEDEAARAVHVDQLVATMQNWSADRAILLTGDLNLHADDAPDVPLLARIFDEVGLTDSCAATGCPEPDHIDRIGFRGSPSLMLSARGWQRDARYVDGDGVDLSDHPAISATLAWSAE